MIHGWGGCQHLQEVRKLVTTVRQMKPELKLICTLGARTCAPSLFHTVSRIILR
jgi:hypothetical protein